MGYDTCSAGSAYTMDHFSNPGKIGHNSLDGFELAVKSDNFVDECGSIAEIGIIVVLSNSPSDSDAQYCDVIAKLRYLLDRMIHCARIIKNLNISKSC